MIAVSCGLVTTRLKSGTPLNDWSLGAQLMLRLCARVFGWHAEFDCAAAVQPVLQSRHPTMHASLMHVYTQCNSIKHNATKCNGNFW